MQFIDEIKDDVILLTPTSVKEKILKYIDEKGLLVNIKFISINDLKNGLYFNYDNKAIDYVMKNYSITYSIAKELIDNMYYVDDTTSSLSKITTLRNIKMDLEENKLLIKANLFTELLKSKDTLYVYGFDYLSKYNMHLLEEAKKYVPVIIVQKEENIYSHNVYELNTSEEEIAFVCEEISKLLDKGVNINNIYLTNYDDTYYFTIKRIFKLYNLPITLKRETSLYDTYMGSYFLENLGTDKVDLIKMLVDKFDIKANEYNQKAFNSLVSLINTYYWTDDLLSVKDMISEELKKVKLSTSEYKNEIKITSILDNIFTEADYVFMIGFNLENTPKLKKDEDYINDEIKPTYLDKSYEYNTDVKAAYINAFKNIKNLTITYKLNDSFNSYMPSHLIESEYLTKVKKVVNYSAYSDNFNKLKLTENIDLFIKYNEEKTSTDLLLNTYDIDYNTYDNKYTHINSEKIKSKIDGNISFSYSNISDYYKCPFKFYISNILRIGKYEKTLDQFIGNLFHHCLEVCLDDKSKDVNIVYDKYVQEYTQNEKLTNKDFFFIKALQKEVSFVIDTIKEQYTYSSHNKVWNEKKIEIETERGIKTKIKGFVDKVLLLENKALIIDYKTTNAQKIERELFEFGLSLQLPIYLYLLKELDSNIEVAGIYLQHILNFNNKYEPNKDSLEEKKKGLKLDGLTIKDVDLISTFDSSYENSEVIKSLKLNKTDGEFSYKNRLLTKDEKDELISLVETIINNCIDNVSSACFDIHPIKIQKRADGCDYCEYQDICFRKPKDFNYQEIKEENENADD